MILKGSNHSLTPIAPFFILVYSLDDFKRCTESGLKVGANIYGVYVSVGVHGGSCNGVLNEMGGEVTPFT